MTAPPMINRTYTPDEFLALENSHLFELIDGELVERNMSIRSSLIGMNIAWELKNYAHAEGGFVVGSDGGLRIFGPSRQRWVRFPDVAYFDKGHRLADLPSEGWGTVAPDIVVEVVSPNDMAAEVEAKTRDWLDAGVATVWVAYPTLREIVVHTKSGRYALEGEQALTDERLPGFSVPAASFFPAE